jgi:hypothetical protein
MAAVFRRIIAPPYAQNMLSFLKKRSMSVLIRPGPSEAGKKNRRTTPYSPQGTVKGIRETMNPGQTSLRGMVFALHSGTLTALQHRARHDEKPR